MSNYSNENINVMITGVGGGGHGNEVLKALRMANTNYRIIGADMNPTSLGLYQADKSYVIPAASSPDYIDTLLNICQMENAKVLVTGSEPELKKVSANRGLFEDNGILVLINDVHVIDICMDKWKTKKFLEENEFGYPQSVLLENLEDCKKVNKLPVVLKPAVGGGGSNLTFIAQDSEELEFFAQYILKLGVIPVAQEYIGTPQDEFTVGVLTTFDGRLVGSLAVHRQIMSGLSNKMKIKGRVGKYSGQTLAISSGISQGIIEESTEIRKECERLAVAIGCKGPINIQLRFVEGKVYTFEINPRFSGTSAFRAMVGYNEPDILIRHHLLGEPIEPVSYKYGEVVRGLVEKFILPNEIVEHYRFTK